VLPVCGVCIILRHMGSPLQTPKANSGRITLNLRSRTGADAKVGETGSIVESVANWNADQTGIIVCDMWDRHWCAGASSRVEALAPVMDHVLKVARRKGVLIVHAPSDTMAFYRNYPQRQRAINAPSVAPSILTNRTFEPPLPIDDSDGGCDTETGEQWCAWTCQHPSIEIASEDAISDDGGEIYSLFEEREIQNVILMGVHTNMCVLGRSFGLRRMVAMGKNVVLMRDLTDSMYNPARAPYVSHVRGTALVINHIEAYVCPTALSTDITGEPPFGFREDSKT